MMTMDEMIAEDTIGKSLEAEAAGMEEMNQKQGAEGVLNGFAVIAFVLSVSTLYVQWNRYAASRDAAEYAAKIRQQQRRGSSDDLASERLGSGVTKAGGKSTLEGAGLEMEEDKGEDDDDFEIIDLPSKIDEANSSGNDSEEEEEKEEEEAAIKTQIYLSSLKSRIPSVNEDGYGAKKRSIMQIDPGRTETVSNENQWRCACEGGFLPPGMLSSLGGAEAVFRLGTGQCYHKQT